MVDDHEATDFDRAMSDVDFYLFGDAPTDVSPTRLSKPPTDSKFIVGNFLRRGECFELRW